MYNLEARHTKVMHNAWVSRPELAHPEAGRALRGSSFFWPPLLRLSLTLSTQQNTLR